MYNFVCPFPMFFKNYAFENAFVPEKLHSLQVFYSGVDQMSRRYGDVTAAYEFVSAQ